MSKSLERGETLLEILITLVLVAIGVTAVLTALTTSIRGTRSTGATSDARALLVAAAEQIQAATYIPCAAKSGANSYDPAIAVAVKPQNGGGANVAAVTITVTAIDFWTTTAGVQTFSTTGDCSYDNVTTAYSRLQRITLRAATDEKLTIVKRAR